MSTALVVDGRPARVFVTRLLPGNALERFDGRVELDVWQEEAAPTVRELVERARDADGLVTQVDDRVDAAFVAACPSLRVISNVAVGYDNFDVGALSARRIPAGNTPGVLTDATADLAFALILCVARRVMEARDALYQGRVGGFDLHAFLGLELSGATLGVIGAGRIGQAVMERARAFGMKTIAYSRTERDLSSVRFVPLEECLASADVLSVHLPLNEQTRQFIGPDELAQMKPSAFLINTSRGAVIDEDALVAALSSGEISGAGLDVTVIEPMPLAHPLMSLPNCVVLPHIGSATVTARSAMADLAVTNVLAGLSGERLPHCVNPEVYDIPR